MADYIPTNETDIDAWFLNFNNKMIASGADHGFSSDEIHRVSDDYSVLHSLVQGSETMRVNSSEYTAYKKIILYGGANDLAPGFPILNVPVIPPFATSIAAGIIKRVRAMVARLKASPNYNEAVGQDFQVIGTSQALFSLDTAKPLLKIKPLPNSLVEIGFVKGESDGLELELQRGIETTWTRVGKFIKTLGEDDTPLITANTPEVRRYRGRFPQGNKPIGNFSDIVSIVTTP